MREENHFMCDAWKQTKMREFHCNCGKLGRSDNDYNFIVFLHSGLSSFKKRSIS
jgi:hypothetical protein